MTQQQSKKRVLFLCTGNSARSQMAEAFLKKYAGDKFDVYSAGLRPKGINPFTIRVMEELGFDLSGQESHAVTEYLGKDVFHHYITVCSQAEEDCARTFPNAQRRTLHWDHFEDPAAFQGSDEATLNKFREVRDQIDQELRNWLAGQNIEIHLNSIESSTRFTAGAAFIVKDAALAIKFYRAAVDQQLFEQPAATLHP